MKEAVGRVIAHARFWALVGEAHGSSKALVRVLKNLSPDEVAGFDAWFWAYYMATSREDLWAAVYAIRGGCGDDSFDYFRGWLIGRGEAAVLAAIRDPESLLELIGDADPRDEGMLGAARRACPAIPDHAADVAIPGRDAWPADRIARGLKWNHAFYAAHFPRLGARYFAEPEPPEPMIEHDRFWAIVDGAVAGARTADAAMAALAVALGELSRDELIGFDRWLSAYNQALIRTDLRWACRIVVGKDDGETVAGFRGWILVQGRDAVHVATHELDTIVDRARFPVAHCLRVIFATDRAKSAHGIYRSAIEDDPPAIPDRDTWSPDLDKPSVADLRVRFPRLTDGIGDDRLGAPYDFAKLAPYDRQRIAVDRFERAKVLEPAARLPLLDEAHLLWPTHDDIRALRGRTHAQLGNLDAALADLDDVLASQPDFALSRWERAKIREARGGSRAALADARAAAERVAEARTWLSTLSPGTPKRVRHAKFGDGTVVSVDATGSEPKLVVDFAVGRKTIARRFVETVE